MRRLRLFFWAPVLLVGSLLITAGPAGAAGNAALNAFIISNPGPGWNPVPTGLALKEAASPLEGVRGSYKGKAVAAFKLWTSPGPELTEGLMEIGMVAFPHPSASIRSRMHQRVRDAAVSLCKPVVGKAPALQPIASIPGGRIITCRGYANGVVGVVGRAAFFSRANVLVRVVSTSLNATQMLSIASRQYKALPRTHFGPK
jgi:hypothetical protein